MAKANKNMKEASTTGAIVGYSQPFVEVPGKNKKKKEIPWYLKPMKQIKESVFEDLANRYGEILLEAEPGKSKSPWDLQQKLQPFPGLEWKHLPRPLKRFIIAKSPGVSEEDLHALRNLPDDVDARLSAFYEVVKKKLFKGKSAPKKKREPVKGDENQFPGMKWRDLPSELQTHILKRVGSKKTPEQLPKDYHRWTGMPEDVLQKLSGFYERNRKSFEIAKRKRGSAAARISTFVPKGAVARKLKKEPIPRGGTEKIPPRFRTGKDTWKQDFQDYMKSLSGDLARLGRTTAHQVKEFGSPNTDHVANVNLLKKQIKRAEATFEKHGPKWREEMSGLGRGKRAEEERRKRVEDPRKFGRGDQRGPEELARNVDAENVMKARLETETEIPGWIDKQMVDSIQRIVKKYLQNPIFAKADPKDWTTGAEFAKVKNFIEKTLVPKYQGDIVSYLADKSKNVTNLRFSQLPDEFKAKVVQDRQQAGANPPNENWQDWDAIPKDLFQEIVAWFESEGQEIVPMGKGRFGRLQKGTKMGMKKPRSGPKAAPRPERMGSWGEDEPFKPDEPWLSPGTGTRKGLEKLTRDVNRQGHGPFPKGLPGEKKGDDPTRAIGPKGKEIGTAGQILNKVYRKLGQAYIWGDEKTPGVFDDIIVAVQGRHPEVNLTKVYQKYMKFQEDFKDPPATKHGLEQAGKQEKALKGVGFMSRELVKHFREPELDALKELASLVDVDRFADVGMHDFFEEEIGPSELEKLMGIQIRKSAAKILKKKWLDQHGVKGTLKFPTTARMKLNLAKLLKIPTPDGVGALRDEFWEASQKDPGHYDRMWNRAINKLKTESETDYKIELAKSKKEQERINTATQSTRKQTTFQELNRVVKALSGSDKQRNKVIKAFQKAQELGVNYKKLTNMLKTVEKGEDVGSFMKKIATEIPVEGMEDFRNFMSGRADRPAEGEFQARAPKKGASSKAQRRAATRAHEPSELRDDPEYMEKRKRSGVELARMARKKSRGGMGRDPQEMPRSPDEEVEKAFPKISKRAPEKAAMPFGLPRKKERTKFMPGGKKLVGESEGFEDSYDMDVEADEEAWEDGKAPEAKDWTKQLSLESLFFGKRPTKKKRKR